MLFYSSSVLEKHGHKHRHHTDVFVFQEAFCVNKIALSDLYCLQEVDNFLVVDFFIPNLWFVNGCKGTQISNK